VDSTQKSTFMPEPATRWTRKREITKTPPLPGGEIAGQPGVPRTHLRHSYSLLCCDLTAPEPCRLKQGLGDVYEEEYVRARTGNAVEDKDEATRSQARVLLKGLFAKLDALSHFHFAPKPIIKEMAVQSEVPALAMEEVAPQVLFLSIPGCRRVARGLPLMWGVVAGGGEQVACPGIGGGSIPAAVF